MDYQPLTSFYNLHQKNMGIENVIENIYNFIFQDLDAEYKLAIGTDSQVKKKQKLTRFVTGLIIHRKGKGAWGCRTKHEIPRRVTSLKEKISTEVSYSQELCFYLMEHFRDILEVHIDIGEDGATSELIDEMTGRIKAMGIKVEIKPFSFVASGYCNRFTK